MSSSLKFLHGRQLEQTFQNFLNEFIVFTEHLSIQYQNKSFSSFFSSEVNRTQEANSSNSIRNLIVLKLLMYVLTCDPKREINW